VKGGERGGSEKREKLEFFLIIYFTLLRVRRNPRVCSSLVYCR
jgi:hypothetical protein